MLVRKTVTVLFCDVAESTRLGELDPEAHRTLISRYFEEMSAALERHGGTVEKFIGDAVMAVFGVPTVHEDDALRAVRAATEMRERLESSTTSSTRTTASGWRCASASTPERWWQATALPGTHSSPATPSSWPSDWRKPRLQGRS